MTRDRITITIREDLLKQIDRLQDGISIRSRSQAFEYLLSKILSDVRLKSALVLAGGAKKDILIKKQPKFLADISGKTILERVLNSIHEFNVMNLNVYTDNFSDEIESFIKSRNQGFDVNFIRGSNASGTIRPLLLAKPNVSGNTFLVAYGDTLCSLNLNEMLSFHKKNNALATLALTTVSNPKDFGVVMLQGNKINSFVQKPKKELGSYLISAGYCLFEPEIFRHILKSDKSLESDLFPRLAEKGLLFGYPFQGLYLNINSESDLQRARVLL